MLPPPFLRVPLEIRLLVYDVLWPPFPPEDIFPAISTKGQLQPGLSSSKLTLLQTCRQLYLECRDLARGRTAFHVVAADRPYAYADDMQTGYVREATCGFWATRTRWRDVWDCETVWPGGVELQEVRIASFFGFAFFAWVDPMPRRGEWPLLWRGALAGLETVAIPLSGRKYYPDSVDLRAVTGLVNWLPNLRTVAVYVSNRIQRRERLTEHTLSQLDFFVDEDFGPESKCSKQMHLNHRRKFHGSGLRICIGVVARHLDFKTLKAAGEVCVKFPVRHVRIVMGDEDEVKAALQLRWGKDGCGW